MSWYKKNNLKTTLLSQWTFARIIRVGLGVFLLVNGFITYDWILGALGTLLLLQGTFNVGCCGAGGCDVSHTATRPKSLKKDTEEITFTEIK